MFKYHSVLFTDFTLTLTLRTNIPNTYLYFMVFQIQALKKTDLSVPGQSLPGSETLIYLTGSQTHRCCCPPSLSNYSIRQATQLC